MSSGPPAAESPLVDMHIHLLPGAILRAYRRRSRPPLAEVSDTSVVLRFGAGYTERIPREATDIGQVVATLDRHSVDMAVLSVNQPGVIGLPDEEAVALSREANDELADLASDASRRLHALAVLPWQCPAAAAEELRRAVGLGLRGAMVCSNVGGRPLDEPDFEPVFAAAAALDVPLLLHPTLPLSTGTMGDYGLTCPVAFLFDTTTAILRLTVSGLFDRHPQLKVVLCHAGSLLPQLAGRLDLEQDRGMLGGVHTHRTRFSEDYLKRLYTDTVGGSVGAITAALGFFGADHVMFGTDSPFWDHATGLSLLVQVGLPPESLQRVRGGTAIELFDLQRGP